jgi:hypothetical protein
MEANAIWKKWNIGYGRVCLVMGYQRQFITEVTWQTLSEYTSPLTWFELTTLVELGTHCISRWKYNYYAITTTIGSFVNIKIQNVNRKWIHCICIEYNITHNTRKWISSFFTCNATQLIEAQHLTTRFHQDHATLKRQHNLLKHNIWPQGSSGQCNTKTPAQLTKTQHLTTRLIRTMQH